MIDLERLERLAEAAKKGDALLDRAIYEREACKAVPALIAAVRERDRALNYIIGECTAAIAGEPIPEFWRKCHPEATHDDVPNGLRSGAHIKLAMIREAARSALGGQS